MPRQRGGQGPQPIDIGNIPAQIQAARQRRVLAPRLSGPSRVPSLQPAPDIQSKNQQRIHDQANFFNVMEASNKIEKKARDLVFNPDSGLINLKGKNSFDSLKTFNTEMSSEQISIYENLTSAEQRQSFLTKKDSIMRGYSNTLDQHVRSEKTKWEQAEYQSWQKLGFEAAADHSNDPTWIMDKYNEMIVENDQFQKKMGLGFEASELGIQKVSDDFAKIVLDKNFAEIKSKPVTGAEASEALKDVEILKKNFQNMHKNMSPSLRKSYAKKIRAAVDGAVANAGALAIIEDDDLYVLVDEGNLGEALRAASENVKEVDYGPDDIGVGTPESDIRPATPVNIRESEYLKDEKEAQDAFNSRVAVRNEAIKKNMKDMAIKLLRERAAVNSGVRTENKRNFDTKLLEAIQDPEKTIESVQKEIEKIPVKSQRPHYSFRQIEGMKELDIMNKAQIPIKSDPLVKSSLLNHIVAGNLGAFARDFQRPENYNKLSMGDRFSFSSLISRTEAKQRKEKVAVSRYSVQPSIKTLFSRELDKLITKTPVFSRVGIDTNRYSSYLVGKAGGYLEKAGGVPPTPKELNEFLNSPDGIKFAKENIKGFLDSETKEWVNSIETGDLDVLMNEVTSLPEISALAPGRKRTIIVGRIKEGKIDITEILSRVGFSDYKSIEHYESKDLTDSYILQQFLKDFWEEYWDAKGY